MSFSVLADWDNTLAGGWTVFPWLRHLSNLGLVEQEWILRVEFLRRQHTESRLAHDDLARRIGALYQASVAAASLADLESAGRSFISTAADALRPWAPDLLAGITARGGETLVISGAPYEALAALVSTLPIGRTYFFQQRLTDEDPCSRLSGPGDATSKRRIVESLRPANVLLALGDSESDEPLLRVARLRVVVGDKWWPSFSHQLVAEDGRGINDVWRRLDALLES